MPAPSVPLDAIRQPAFLYNADGRIVAANDRVEALAGRSLVNLSAPEMVALLDIRSPDGTPLAPADLPSSRALCGEEVVEEPFTVARPDGRSLEILATAAPVCEDDSITGALIIWQDVTEQRTAEEDLRKSEVKYRQLFESISEGFTLCEMVYGEQGDPIDYIVLDANPAFEQVTAIPPNRVIGRRISEAYPAYTPSHLKAFDSVVKTRAPLRFEEYSPTYDRWFGTFVFPVGSNDRFGQIFSNITERKRAEEALLESEQKIRAITEAMPAILWTTDTDYRYTYSVGRGLASLDLEQHETEGRTMFEVMGTTDPDHPALVAMRTALSGIPSTYEIEYQGRVFLATILPLRDAEERIVGTVGATVDITEQRETAEALRESETRFRELFDSSRDVISRHSLRTGRFDYISPSCVRLSGWTNDELLAMDYEALHAMIHPDDGAVLDAMDAELTASGTAEGEYRQRTKDGGYYWTSSHLQLVRDENGRPLSIIASARDITERKRAEDALRESEAQLASILALSVDAIYRRDLGADGYAYVNPAIESVTGIPLEEFAMLDPTGFVNIVHPGDRAAIEAGLADPESLSGTIEYRLLGRDGRYRWLADHFGIQRDADGTPRYITGVIRDMTEQRESEEALRRYADDLDRAQAIAHVGSWSWEIGSDRLAWSDEAYRIFGLEPGEIPAPSNEDFLAFVHPDDRDRVAAAIQDALVDGQYDIEFRFARKGGDVGYAHSQGAVTFADGAPVRMEGIVQDITERKRDGEAMAAARRQLQDIIDNTPAIIYAFDPEERFIMANATVAELFAATPEEMIGKRRHAFMPRKDADWHEANDRMVFEAGQALNFEESSQIGDRAITWLTTKFPLRDAQGQIYAVAGISADITERKRAEEALQASEGRYRELVEQAGSIILRYDPEGRITFANEYAERFFGFAPGELLGLPAVGTIIPETESTGRDLAAMVREIPLDPDRFAQNENENMKKNGERVWVRWSNKPILAPDGTVREFLAVGMDITERKRTEQALAGVNRILSAALESESEEALGEACLAVAEEITQSRFGFLDELDESGLLHDIAISDPGWDACAMTDQSGHRRRPGTFVLRGLYGRVIEEGRSLIANDPARHPDAVGVQVGHPALTAFLGVPLMRDRRTIGMIGVGNRAGGYTDAEQRLLEALALAIVDAFDRFRAAQALRRYATDLERSNADLERFAYVSSHDLQEPLRSIVSFSQLLERRYKGQLGQDADEYIDFIVEGGNRMQTLILDLLAYSRVNSKAQEPHPTDAEAVMAAVERNLDGQLREAGAMVTYDSLPVVTADPLQLEQVFANLVSNAIKFRKPDEPLHVHVGARRLDGFWEFSVRDNGIGIEKEYYDKIFVIFQRLHTKEAYPGTGIGLAIVKRIIDRHGGTVRVESTPGEGSTFFFTLPAA